MDTQHVVGGFTLFQPKYGMDWFLRFFFQCSFGQVSQMVSQMGSLVGQLTAQILVTAPAPLIRTPARAVYTSHLPISIQASGGTLHNDRNGLKHLKPFVYSFLVKTQISWLRHHEM